MAFRPYVTTSPSPAASTSPATTPFTSSAILSDCPIFFREDGAHPSATVEGAGGGGGGDGAATAAAAPAGRVVTAAVLAGGVVWTGAAAGGGAGETARIAPCTPNSFSAISPDRTPSWGMISSSVAAAAKNAPADAPVAKSVTVVSMLYPFPSLDTVPWRRRGYFASFAASSGGFPPGERRRTSAPASAIRREDRRRGRTATVESISSFARETNGATATRRGYPAAIAGNADAATTQRKTAVPRAARPIVRTRLSRISRNLTEGGESVNEKRRVRRRRRGTLSPFIPR